ncbi:hypothetical protein VCR14J2_260045 [Vibrio coralliirubri]|nr:hypothetical protein VCR14J2_260045 [Vibrio coralliirubri]
MAPMRSFESKDSLLRNLVGKSDISNSIWGGIKIKKAVHERVNEECLGSLTKGERIT